MNYALTMCLEYNYAKCWKLQNGIIHQNLTGLWSLTIGVSLNKLPGTVLGILHILTHLILTTQWDMT